MNKIVLYCKSYAGDYERVKVLVESIHKFNKDNIPTFISVPSKDVVLFLDLSGMGVNIIEDEDIYDVEGPGWITQQIVKSNFWKLELCENYVCIDSDGYFIKDFYITDFMYDDKTPYTLIHEQKELFSWSVTKTIELGFDPKQSFISDRDKIMALFNRSGKYYDFGPSAIIWSSKVWQSLYDKDRKSTRLNSSHVSESRMPSSA